MKKDILSWNDVKKRYLEFYKMDSFTENMAIDIDFGYWLVNNCNISDAIKSACLIGNEPIECNQFIALGNCQKCTHFNKQTVL